MKRMFLSALAAVLIASGVAADPKILPMRERAAVIDNWLAVRVQTVLPDLMRRSDIDMWVISFARVQRGPCPPDFPAIDLAVGEADNHSRYYRSGCW